MINGDHDLEIVWSLLMKGAIVIMLLGASVGSCCYIHEKMGMPNDHPLEEFVERAIESHLGLPENSIDLTPCD